jgi:hypothetical protein
LGLLPHTKVEFELVGDHARIRKLSRPMTRSEARGRDALAECPEHAPLLINPII